MDKCSDNRGHHKDKAQLSVYDDYIMKESADGFIVVIDHGHQH